MGEGFLRTGLGLGPFRGVRGEALEQDGGGSGVLRTRWTGGVGEYF
jgi:hypothetical protein